MKDAAQQRNLIRRRGDRQQSLAANNFDGAILWLLAPFAWVILFSGWDGHR